MSRSGIEREEVVRQERIKRGEAARKILLVAVAASIMLFFIIDNQHKRTDQREILARMLALNAQSIMDRTIDNLELAMLLAIESLKITEFSPKQPKYCHVKFLCSCPRESASAMKIQ
ncbi:MAG: hypothetical protein MZV70_34835 [Desulfobacterales bacterium]|nr:hypothetical protein [Desulfobacterales bacterium]